MSKEDTETAFTISGLSRIGIVDLTGTKKRAKGKRRFVMAFVDTEIEPELDERIKDFDLRLLSYLVKRSDETNEVRLMQREMAADFKTRKARISESIGRLRDAGYISTDGGYGILRINPEYYWRTSLVENEKIVGMK